MELDLINDLCIVDNDISVDRTLKNAIMISLFSDKRAGKHELSFDDPDTGGWWANPKIGSRLWLLRREKITPDLLTKIKNYCLESLQWLPDTGACSSVSVEVRRTGTHSVEINVSIKKNHQNENYSFNWDSN